MSLLNSAANAESNASLKGLLYMSGAVLMRSIWGQRRSGRTVNVDRDVALLEAAVEILDSIKYE